MQYFELVEPTGNGIRVLDAAHPASLPAVRCSTCGRTWSTIGISYPTIDVHRLPRDVQAPGPPVDVAGFRVLQQQVARAIGDSRPIPPGTSFGPLKGTASGETRLVEWLNPWTLLIDESIFEQIRLNTGVSLSGERARLTPSSLKGTRRLTELEIPVCGRVRQGETAAEVCAVCGYQRLRREEPLALIEGSLPRGVHILRPLNLPTAILASESLVSGLQSLNLDQIACRPLPLD